MNLDAIRLNWVEKDLVQKKSGKYPKYSVTSTSVWGYPDHPFAVTRRGRKNEWWDYKVVATFKKVRDAIDHAMKLEAASKRRKAGK